MKLYGWIADEAISGISAENVNSLSFLASDFDENGELRWDHRASPDPDGHWYRSLKHAKAACIKQLLKEINEYKAAVKSIRKLKQKDFAESKPQNKTT